MAGSGEEFARLLTQGVHRIRLCESNKLISAVQDELGRALGRKAGTAIEYWRKGHIPARPSDVEKLAREIVQRSDLGRAWLEKFLDSAGYPDPLSLCDELFPPPLPGHIPSKLYRKLVGRDALVDDIMAALWDPDGRWMVTIDGMGGIGKTALAREVVDQGLKERHFDAVVWVGESRREPAGEDRSERDALTFETILNTIGHQLGAPDISSREATERETHVRELLRRQRVLVVLDNLETAGEPQNEIARRLRPLLNPSKGLLISRHRFKGDLYRVHLTGLDEESALAFIHQEAEEKGLRRVGMATRGELAQIVEATGGSPLAMKLVVGQLSHLPLETVLQHLRTGRPLDNETDSDDYVRFYNFIYFPSWELLSEAGKQLLLSMALFIPGVGATPEAIGAVSDLADGVLMRHIQELWQLSFLEVGEPPGANLEQVRYYLHALTRYFVLSDIVDRAAEGVGARQVGLVMSKQRNLLSDLPRPYFQQATQRFVEYHVRYVEAHAKDYRVLDMEAGSILEALRIAFDQGMHEALVRGANAFHHFLETRGLYGAAEVHLSHAEQAARSLGDGVGLATTLLNLGIIARRQGKYTQAEAYLQEGLALAQEAQQRKLAGAILTNLGSVAVEVGAYEQAEAYWLEGLTLARTLEQHESISDLLQNLGLLADIRGDYARAEERLQEGLVSARKTGDPGRISALLQSLAVVAFNVGDYTQAETHLREGLALAREVGDVRRISHVLGTLGAAEFCRGDYAQAEKHWLEQLALLRQIEYPVGISTTLANLGAVSGNRGDHGRAEAYLQEGLALARKTGHSENICYALDGLGAVAVRRGDHASAKAYLLEGLALARELAHRELISALLRNLGAMAVVHGDYTRAEEYLRESLDLAREIGHRWHTNATLNEWGELHLRQHKHGLGEANVLDVASAAFREVLEMAQEMGAREQLAMALYGLARVAAAQGNTGEAQRQGQASLALFETMEHYKATEVKGWLAGLPP